VRPSIKRLSRSIRALGSRLASLFAALPPTLPALPPSVTRGALDVRSNDLGDSHGWQGRSPQYNKFTDIKKAFTQDALLLRGVFLPEQLARQGGVTLEAASASDLSARKAEQALLEIEAFLDRVVSPFGEGWEETFFRTVGELSRFSNFALEMAWDTKSMPGNVALLPWESMNLLVDKRGWPVGWVQFDYWLRPSYFELHEICHGAMNRQSGDRYGTPGLDPTAGKYVDLEAFRAIEGLAGQQYQHLIFPTRLIKAGSEQYPETSKSRLTEFKDAVEDMYREGYMVGSGRESLESDAPQALDPSGMLEYFKKKVVQATGFSLVRLGEGGDTNVATAEVMSHNENMDQRGRVLVACDSWRRGVFSPYLASIGMMPQFAPSLVPGEPDPVRRQRKAEHAANLYGKGIITLDEARAADGRAPLSDEQRSQLEQDRAAATPDPQAPTDQEDKREKRQEDRSK